MAFSGKLSMPRDFRVSLDNIVEAAQKIATYTAGFTFETFPEDVKTVDAVPEKDWPPK